MKRNLKLYLTYLVHFFPLKLLIFQLKRNYILVGFWALLFSIISYNFGDKYGIPNLFLVPEYQSTISFGAFIFMGLITGAFIMAYNIASYESNSFKFPFIATLSRPFYKFTINNSTLPAIYLIYYTYQSAKAQNYWEYITNSHIFLNLMFFWFGVSIFIIISFLFFFYINRKIGIKEEKLEKFNKKKLVVPIKKIIDKEKEWKIKNRPDEVTGISRVETYLFSPFKIRKARDVRHYNENLLNQVFEKTHKNAAFYSLFIIILIIIRGIFSGITAFNFPAGGSILLVFTLFLLLLSAIHSFFKNWTYLILFIGIFGLNLISYLFDGYNHTAYGLDYSKQDQKCDIKKDISSQNFFKDYETTLQILENWKKKNTINKKQKPKLVIINASGGGLKMAIWAYLSLSKADSSLNGQLLKHTALITGSSGGMIGTAYLRELYLQSLNSNKKYFGDSLLTNLEKDLLNPIMYRFAAGDWFFRVKKFTYDNKKYFIDRGYAFEKAFNNNTNHILDKSLISYREPEKNALIPMMFLSPAIINDGRQLLISAQDISYMIKKTGNITEKINFRKAYAAFNADNLRFTTALRMNASFPYVSPMTILPGYPQIATIDAGLRDNLGYSVSLEFIHIFKSWIERETSGVIILQLYENEKHDEIKYYTMLDKIFKPAGTVYNDLYKIQELNNLQLSDIISSELENNITIIPLTFGDYKNKLSLSWHLTSREKRYLHQEVESKKFKTQVLKLKSLIR